MLVPFRLVRLDPHALHDPLAGLFGSAIADPLFSLDALGRVYPALAASLPEIIPGGARVRLRGGLRTARGKPLAAPDVIASLSRARRRGAAPLLAGFGAPVVAPGDRLALDFARAEPRALGEILASPLLSVLPRGYSTIEPDGTGAFAARFEKGGLLLERNIHAARGPAFLDRIEVGTVANLADALRAFESGTVDIGWLGSGLHRPRRDAVAFRGAQYGWAILRTGRKAGAWGAPGVAQQLLDNVDPSRLRHLGLSGLAESRGSSLTWGAGRAEIQVLEDAPQLVLVAKSLAEALGSVGHELTVTLKTHEDIERTRIGGDFALMVDFVRTLGPKGPMTQYALLAAQNPELAKKPPRVDTFEARAIAGKLSLGVIGELWVGGAHARAQQNLSGWVLGNAWRAPSAR